MNRLLCIILLLSAPLAIAVAGGEGGGSDMFEAPFLFQIVPFSPFTDVSIEADVNIGMVAAAVSSVNGFQFAPGAAFAERVGGVQASGVLNWTDELEGLQVGIFNRAKSGDGCQIGVINFSDDSDIRSVGLFNFHKDSWMDLLIFADSVSGIAAAYQCGLGSFYSCYSAGGMPGNAPAVVTSVTAGLRFNTGLFFMEAEGGISQRYPDLTDTDISALMRLKAGLKLFDVFSVFVGAGGQAGSDYKPDLALLSTSYGEFNFFMSAFGGIAFSIK